MKSVFNSVSIIFQVLVISIIGTVAVYAEHPIEESDASPELKRLMTAVSGDSPLISDLQSLTDEIGGRTTGTQANQEAVEWAYQRLKQAGLKAWKEPFDMPQNWQELSVSATISGSVFYTPRVVSKPFSGATTPEGIEARLLDGGFGFADDMDKLGARTKGAWILIETPVLDDVVGLSGLFKEYNDAVPIETAVIKSGAAGIIFISSRQNNLLFRHNASRGFDNKIPLLVIEREAGLRSLRLIRSGKKLTFKGTIKTLNSGVYISHNVLAEIPGNDLKDEIVIFGAHLDSFDLGTGALDNGANVTMLINIARQIQSLGLTPRRTIRIGLWNGEEQGFYGSRGYTRVHESEMDNHKLATSFDIGTGRINGFFTGARPQLVPIVDKAMESISTLGPFTQIDVPIVGTDNFDFMMEGIPNLVANQEDANYASNYHARSDTFDKVDQKQLRLNSAVVAALIWHFANVEKLPDRQTLKEIEDILATTDLEAQMRSMNVWQLWVDGKLGLGRGR